MKTLFLTTISDTIKNKKKLSVVFKANIQIYCNVVPIETVFLKNISWKSDRNSRGSLTGVHWTFEKLLEYHYL